MIRHYFHWTVSFSVTQSLCICVCVISFHLHPCQLSPSDLSLCSLSLPLFKCFLIVFFYLFSEEGHSLNICYVVWRTKACCHFFPCPVSVVFLPNAASKGTLHLIIFQMTKKQCVLHRLKNCKIDPSFSCFMSVSISVCMSQKQTRVSFTHHYNRSAGLKCIGQQTALF